jgi:hypothetical protein
MIGYHQAARAANTKLGYQLIPRPSRRSSQVDRIAPMAYFLSI